MFLSGKKDNGFMEKTLSLLSLLVSIFFSFSLVSCATSVHMPVPGENSARKNSIYNEYMSIADAYSDLGKYDKASLFYEQAMKNKKLYWTASYKLARSYAMNKQYEKSISVYKNLIKRDPDNISLKMSYAYVLSMSGELEKACQEYKILVEKNPENQDLLSNYIIILFAMEDYENAEEKLNVLKDLFKENKNIASFEKKLEEYRKKLEDQSAETTVTESDGEGKKPELKK